MSNTPEGDLIDYRVDDYFRYEEEMDKANDITRRRFKNASTHYYIPPQENTMFKCREAIGKMHTLLLPTLTQQNHDATRVEIIQRLYRHMALYVNEYNKCLGQALDYHDYNKCSKKIIDAFENEGIEFTKSLAKEY